MPREKYKSSTIKIYLKKDFVAHRNIYKLNFLLDMHGKRKTEHECCIRWAC
jgi:hypothetical protein